MNVLDVSEMISETNKCLRLNQQIHPDDPLVASVILHNHILNAQVDALNKKLDETLQQFTAVSDEQLEKAETIAAALILRAGNNIEKQLNTAAQRWEDRLRNAGAEGEARIWRASWLAWFTEILFIVAACVMLGSYLGSLLNTLAHHVK